MNLIDQYMAKLEPRALEVGAVACAYMDRVLSRLDIIADRLADSDSDIFHARTVHTVTPTRPLEYTSFVVGREYELMHFSTTGGVSLLLNGLPLVTTTGADTVTPNGVILRPGDTLSATSGVDIFVTLIVREYTVTPPRDTVGPLGPDRLPIRNEMTGASPDRHGPTAYPGIESLTREGTNGRERVR